MADTASIPLLAGPAEPTGTRSLLPARSVVVGVAALLLVLAALGGAWFAGVRVHVVESPSMGQAAPVGSLVIGMAGGRVARGDLITFQPPSASATPYTHRVVGRTAAGVLTRGDINGAPDPWVVTDGMVLARTVAVLPGVGWLVRAMPAVLAALVLAQIVGLFVRSPATRWSIRTAAVAVGVAWIAWTMKPFSGFVVLQSAAGSGIRSTVVSTALVPIRVTAVHGGSVQLASGQVGHVTVPQQNGVVTLSAQLALDPLGWVLVALVCLAPVLAVLVVGVPVEDPGDAPA